MDSDFVIIAHGELASGQFCVRRLLREFESQLFVLSESAFVAKQKPSADTKRSFWLRLGCGQTVVVK